jgi:hypothetical protein
MEDRRNDAKGHNIADNRILLISAEGGQGISRKSIWWFRTCFLWKIRVLLVPRLR